jgi:Cu/Ag efflux protein CusF
MKPLSIAGALALSFVAAACGGTGTNSLAGQSPASPDMNNVPTEQSFSATGHVTVITADRVTISHGPVGGLGWPAMTMTFQAGSPAMLQGIGVGDPVAFQFRKSGSDYVLTALTKAQ